MKLGFSMVSLSLLSSFFSFHVLHLDMHSNGVTGVHFRHCWSSALSISKKSPYFSVLTWLVMISCVFMCVASLGAHVLTG